MTRFKLLLVDDDAGSILVMNRMLSGLGCTRFATSGSEALRLAQEDRPDLILLDAEMPGMSGFEVCQRLKQHPQLCQVPVIFVTAHSDREVQAACMRLGASDCLTKPLHGDVVIARVLAQLRRAEQRLGESG